MADERILENIKKLKSLGMPDNEIVDNLINIGLSKEESEKLVSNSNTDEKPKSELQEKINNIKEKKQTTKNKTKKVDEKKEIPDDFFSDESGEVIDTPMEDAEDDFSETEELSELKNISKDKDEKIDFDLDLKSKIKEDENDIYKKYEDINQDDLYKKYTTPTVNNNDENDGDKNVWQKGLATTINSKLTELENKQKQIEAEIKAKIDSEISKTSQFQERAHKDIIKMINNVVNSEVEKINTKVITEMAKLKIIEAKINSKIQIIDKDKNNVKELTGEFETLKEDLKHNILETKKRTDLITTGTEENITKILTTMTVKLNEKIKEINSTLSLQSKITEGLIKNTQNAIGTEIKKLNDFQKDIKTQIDPKRIYDKINELEDFKIKLSNRYEERFEKVKNEFLQKAKVAIKSEVEEDLSEINKIKHEIVEKTDPERIEKKLIELKKIEEDLVNTIDQKIEQSLKIYEASITTEFKGKMNEIDTYKSNLEKSVELQKTLEDKIKEIDRFKKQFIAVIDENIEKMNQNMSVVMKKKE